MTLNDTDDRKGKKTEQEGNGLINELIPNPLPSIVVGKSNCAS